MPKIILTVDLPDHLSHFDPDRVAALIGESTELDCTGRWASEAGAVDPGWGVELIGVERVRQRVEHGYTPGHDAGHQYDELTGAAIAYIVEAQAQNGVRRSGPGDSGYWWPWGGVAGDDAATREGGFKPSDDPVRNLVKAGALIAAEIDRLRAVTEAPADSTQPAPRHRDPLIPEENWTSADSTKDRAS